MIIFYVVVSTILCVLEKLVDFFSGVYFLVSK